MRGQQHNRQPPEPGQITREGSHGASHTVFRDGEGTAASPHGRRKSAGWSATADKRQGHQQLWASAGLETGRHAMQNASPPCTGPARRPDAGERRSALLDPVDSEAISVAREHGYQLEEVLHLPPEDHSSLPARRTGGSYARCDEQRLRTRRRPPQGKPVGGQDMQKSRRPKTEIEVLTAHRREGQKEGVPACQAMRCGREL